jgi:endonuclease YncB( thermonuclease family)
VSTLPSVRAFPALVKGVHDGDTFTADIDQGWKHWYIGAQVRMDGIDAPELVDREARALIPAGEESTRFLLDGGSSGVCRPAPGVVGGVGRGQWARGVDLAPGGVCRAGSRVAREA